MQTLHSALKITAGTSGDFDHAFGGTPKMAQPDPMDGKPPLHQLFDLDLSDPALADFAAGGLPRLSLVYPLRYERACLAYRMGRDGEVIVLNRPSLIPTRESATAMQRWPDRPTDDWPYADYPASFPRVPVSVHPLADGSTVDPLAASLLFGPAGGFDPADAEVTHLDEEIPNFETGMSSCIYRDCVARNGSCRVFPFAAIPNAAIPGISLWGEYGSYVWVIFELCPDCRTITTHNVCD